MRFDLLTKKDGKSNSRRKVLRRNQWNKANILDWWPETQNGIDLFHWELWNKNRMYLGCFEASRRNPLFNCNQNLKFFHRSGKISEETLLHRNPRNGLHHQRNSLDKKSFRYWSKIYQLPKSPFYQIKLLNVEILQKIKNCIFYWQSCLLIILVSWDFSWVILVPVDYEWIEVLQYLGHIYFVISLLLD